jgi:hypothetical protein
MYIVVFWYFRYKYLVYTRYLKIWYIPKIPRPIPTLNNPGKIYLVTARHVVFPPDEEPNVLYRHRKPAQRRRNVLLFGDAAVEKHITATKSEIGSKHTIHRAARALVGGC